MSVNAQDVDKMLEEMAQQPQDPPAASPQQALNEAVQPGQHPVQPAAPPKQEFNAQKFGQLLNDNADLRGTVETLKGEIAAMKQQPVQAAQPPQPVQRPDDGGWTAWAQHQAAVVNEIDDATWLANPKGAVEQALTLYGARAGRDLTDHNRRIAQVEAAQVGMAQTLDNEFANFHPDLMKNERRQGAVRYAISQVIADPRFQNLMRNREDRPRAYAVVAKIARAELGLPSDGSVVSLTPEVPEQRRSTFAEMPSGRPHSVGPTTSQGGSDDKAMQDVIAYQASRS